MVFELKKNWYELNIVMLVYTGFYTCELWFHVCSMWSRKVLFYYEEMSWNAARAKTRRHTNLSQVKLLVEE